MSQASILLVGNGWFPAMPGGLNRYVYELTHHLAVSQTQVELCGVGLPAFSSNALVKLTNLAAPDFPLWQRFWSTRRAFANRAMLEPDAINLHFALYSLPVLTSLPRHIPLTFTFHGPWALESEREGYNRPSVLVKQWMEQQVYNRCDRFIVLSKAFGTVLHQSYTIPWSRINIIPGGVDTARFCPNLSCQQARQQLNWPSDRIILFTPRRLVHRMGLDQLLMALAQVKRVVPEVWLAIAGKGPLRSALEQQVQALELADSVQFLGFLPDEQLPIAYQAADLTVVPSQALEGFGLILLESLASGTPVLCTPVGGMPEVLSAFSPALITESVSANAIADRLQSLLVDRLLLPSRTACRDYAASNFDWHIITEQVRQVLLA